MSDGMKDYSHLSEAVSAVLRHRREEIGLSKRKLAEMAGIERVYLIHLERGDKRPTPNALFCLCDALELEPDEFVRLVKEEVRRLAQESDTGKYSEA